MSAAFNATLAQGVGQTSYSVSTSQTELFGSASVDPSCIADQAYVYAQFTCVMDESTQHYKYNKMATTCAIICFIAYLFTIMLRHLYQGGKIQQLEWDMATITAGDYTVEFPIDSDNYRRWYDQEYRKPGGDFENDVAPALSLK